eukprot:scaffold15166_cov18-Tisochrysis_lutea.AAC.1
MPSLPKKKAAAEHASSYLSLLAPLPQAVITAKPADKGAAEQLLREAQSKVCMCMLWNDESKAQA